LDHYLKTNSKTPVGEHIRQNERNQARQWLRNAGWHTFARDSNTWRKSVNKSKTHVQVQFWPDANPDPAMAQGLNMQLLHTSARRCHACRCQPKIGLPPAWYRAGAASAMHQYHTIGKTPTNERLSEFYIPNGVS
jgi:hypothetical protein